MEGLRDKEKLFYPPMSGFGDLFYDKDAVYININDNYVSRFIQAPDPALIQPNFYASAYVF